MCSTCFAGEILHPDLGVVTYNDKYSFRDFTGQKLLDVKDLEGITIFGSCFSQELLGEISKGSVKVFPDNIKNITFINCNLDNVKVKPGWTTTGCSERNFKVKKDKNGKDLGDWIIDTDGNYIKKVNDEEITPVN
jgi:hypothetical protein